MPTGTRKNAHSPGCKQHLRLPGGAAGKGVDTGSLARTAPYNMNPAQADACATICMRTWITGLCTYEEAYCLCGDQTAPAFVLACTVVYSLYSCVGDITTLACGAKLALTDGGLRVKVVYDKKLSRGSACILAMNSSCSLRLADGAVIGTAYAARAHAMAGKPNVVPQHGANPGLRGDLTQKKPYRVASGSISAGFASFGDACLPGTSGVTSDRVSDPRPMKNVMT